MKITTSYAVEILHPGKQFQRTVEIYRAAVAYLIDVVAKESESVFAIAGAKKQMRIVECFIILLLRNIFSLALGIRVTLKERVLLLIEIGRIIYIYLVKKKGKRFLMISISHIKF